MRCAERKVENKKMKKQSIYRFGIYIAGMVVLALGITLNTKSGMGASAIISVPYTVSQGTGLDFSNLTLITYCLLVVLQFIVKGKQRQWSDVLQIVVSIVFTRFMSLFQNGIAYKSGNNIVTDLAVLAFGIIFTGVGAAITVDMQIMPNPGDGIVNAVSMRSGKELGLCKNCIDVFCVACSLAVGFAFGNVLLGVGLGTILSMIGVGRVISLFNGAAKKPLQALAGIKS